MSNRTRDDLLNAARQALARGVADRKHPARHPTLATIGAEGPQQRTVVLRGYDAATATLECHTDRASAKVRELSDDPRAALHIWVPRQKLQLRLAARVAVVHADVERWEKVPMGARKVYGGMPPPGAVMAQPEDFTPAPEIARFTALLCQITAMEVLYLGDEAHLRAVFRRIDDDWHGDWIAP